MSEKAMKICFSIIGVVTLFTIIVGVLTYEKDPTIEDKVELGAVLQDENLKLAKNNADINKKYID